MLREAGAGADRLLLQDGRTPLRYALVKGHEEVAKVLREAGAITRTTSVESW